MRAAKGEWPTYGGDSCSTKHSPLDRITPENVGAPYSRGGPSNGAPMTHMHQGKQYIVFGLGGSSIPSEYVALALPE